MNFVNFIYHMIQFSFIHNGEKIEGNKAKLKGAVSRNSAKLGI